MPKKKNNQEKELLQKHSTINNLLNNIQKGISNLYKNTYFSPNSNKEDLNTIKSNIDSNIDSLLNNNFEDIGVPNISKLYTRMIDGKSSNNKENNITQNIFEDKIISDSFLSNMDQNRLIVEYDEEIDTILKYMPQLQDALEAKKDNVLSADQYSKDFINATNISNINNVAEYESRIKSLKENYNLINFFDSVYNNTATYGEEFVYIIKYKDALKKIFNNKDPLMSSTNEITLMEQTISNLENNYSIINFTENKIIDSNSNIIENINTNDLEGKIKINFNKTGFLTETLKQKLSSIRILKSINESKHSKIVPDDLEFTSAETTDGLIDTSKNNKDEITVPGCIIKRLKRENVIPIYIEDICLGYYYIECKNDEVFKGRLGINDPMLGNNTNRLKLSDNMTTYDKTIRSISNKISNLIDINFINANYDLKKEIYAILKYSYNTNSISTTEITVTYIAPEYMHHSYFKLDPKTHRGISDLHKSLIPAKMWVSLSTTSAIGVMTRGYDRRVYYVKQNVDTNISQTLLNTINQIKKANFGTREFNSIKNVLNITGRYNDMVMPLNSSGDAPIQFEIMPGQNIDIKTDLMDMYEKSAIEAVDIPYDYVTSRGQSDFAIRLTMYNGKFLRYSFKRQAQYEPFMSRILTTLYNAEYGENDKIEVNLPAPAFLNIANTSQMIDNVDGYCEKIVNMVTTTNDSDTFRSYVKNKLMKHYLSTYLDINNIERIINVARIESNIEDSKNQQQ